MKIRVLNIKKKIETVLHVAGGRMLPLLLHAAL